MYTVTYKGAAIYDPRLEDRPLLSATFKLAVNEAGSCTLELPADHPALPKLRMLSGMVELQSDGLPIYRGRILRPVSDFYNTRTVETEGAVACLNDSLIPPFDYPDGVAGADKAENTVAFFFTWLLQQHNNQVTAGQQIKPGVVTVTDPNNYIARSSTDYLTSMEVLKGRLLDILGGYLIPRYEDDGTYLDYYAELPLTNTQTVEFGENLLDISKEADGSDIYTAILPVGSDGLTIAAEADGEITDDLVKEGLLIYSKAGRERYGNITRKVEWSDVTLSYNLKVKAARQLAQEGVTTPETITCKAVDLGCTDDQVAHFRVGRNSIVNSAPHGVAATFPLMEMTLDILSPGETEITLGQTVRTLSGGTLDDQRKTVGILEEQQKQITQMKQETGGVTEAVRNQITEAVQTSQSIIFKAMEDYVKTGDFESYQETVSTQMSILSDSLTISIQQVQSSVTQLGSDMQQQITDITKYFRFTDKGLLIGETGNEVLLRLDNDILQFLRNNYAELWMDPYGVHAEKFQAKRVQIGNMELVGEDDGRLTLRKAGSN